MASGNDAARFETRFAHPEARTWRPALLGALVASLLMSMPVPATADKATNIPGYTFEDLTQNSRRDTSPRVSSGGWIVWRGAYNLPGATGPDTDGEIMLYDGATITQLTDDDIDYDRPVVNNFGDVAYQGPGNDADAEVYVTEGGTITKLTNDAAPGSYDRYPDINDAGVVVWGRSAGSGFYLAISEPDLVRTFWAPGLAAYRPHINALGNIVWGGGGAADTSGTPISLIPSAASLGFTFFPRLEINDLDQVAIEASPGPHVPFVGERAILFWDGLTMNEIYRSPDEATWVGRPDLNDAGVVVFEGRGGLPGSASGGADLELFVFDPEIGVVIQLTDDEVPDLWGTVTGDGTIVWWGLGNYVAGSPSGDDEIFLAVPSGDADGDGVPNGSDICPLEPDVGQLDGGRVGAGGGDGIGDACQCGDVTDDGAALDADADAFQAWLAGLNPPGFAPRKCQVQDQVRGCSILDVVALRRALQAPPLLPGVLQACSAANQF